MSRSNDAGHFFQTSDALAATERKAAKSKNQYGGPIKLPSKILAAHADGSEWPVTSVFVAEATGEIKRVVLESGKVERIFSQGNAPLTCIAVCHETKTLFAGSWNKTIFAIPVDREGSVQKLQGHSDFVKCLLVTRLGGTPVLVSGGADASIIVWDISTANFGTQLHKLKGPTKAAIQDLAIDPLSPGVSIGEAHEGHIEDKTTGDEDDSQSLTLFTASSDRFIRPYLLTRTSFREHPTVEPILAHDTSVYRLHFDSDGDLWTASADCTARHLVRLRAWTADTVLTHSDFVRDILVCEDVGTLVTACRDEDVRVWDAGGGKLVGAYKGHFEEVTALVKVTRAEVVSVSIDGTIRRWRVDKAEVERDLEEQKEREGEGDGKGGGGSDGAGMLTAEEEAELAELMDED